MRGKRVSSPNWNPRACSAKELHVGGQKKTKFDNIVIIDVDCDSCENVIVVDVPESIKLKLRGSRRRKGERIIPFHDVISIDDDDEHADLPGPSGTAAGGDGLDSDSMSTRRNSVDSDADANDCCVVPDRNSTSESSEFTNHHSSEYIIGRRFDLSPELEEDTSKNDFSDSEVMGDSSGDIRQQWEDAFMKRKHDRSDGQVGLGDGVRGSTLHCDGGVNTDRHFPDGPVSSPPNDSNITENASAYGSPSEGAFRNFNYFNQQHSGADRGQFSKETFCPEGGFESSHNDTSVDVERDVHSAGNKNPSCNGVFFFHKERGPQESFSSFDQAKVDKDSNHITTRFNDEDDRHKSSACSKDLDQEENVDGKEPALGNDHLDEHGAVISEETDTPTNRSVLHDVEQIFQNQPDKEVLHERKSTSAQELPQKSPDQMKEEESVNEAEFIAQRSGERNTLDCEDASSAPVIDDDLINGREKLKESYEYKRAIEEEWASRQWQLQLQAEEAQRLKKKKKAETMRKEDMERRQKQRLDEIRETQKKDEETMNLREQLRAEIRRGLSKLELTCFDLASLLRGLGIHVPGQPPLSKEVHAAYKKALLKFHPDRASTKDIRQQVEAEEKFKLISRMKEKFPFT